MAKGTKMNSHEASLLRTRLRQVNIAYSALVRDRTGEERFVRMGELRRERRALMALLFGGATNERRRLASRPEVAMQHAGE
jgi:hypothetical protein